MIQDTLAAITDAIENKKQVIATYDGFRREMCPRVVGYKNGRAQALFYQFGGESKSGLQAPDSPNNWRCVPLDGLTVHEIRSGEWYSGPNHSRPQRCVDEIVTEVDSSDWQAAGA